MSLHIELLDSNSFGMFEIEEPIEHEKYDMNIFFYGSRYEIGSGSSVMFVTLQGIPLHISFKLSFDCTNNNA